MSPSPCPTFAQAARQAGALPQAEGKERPGAAGGGMARATTATAAQGLLRAFKALDQKPRLHMHAGRLGGRRGRRKTEGRLPGDCDLGAGPREEKLAAVTERKIKALGLDSGGKKVLEEMKEQSRLSVCPHRVGHYLSCMTSRRKTIPEQHGALDTTRGTEGRARGAQQGWGRVSWLCTRWHKRCTSSSSWKSVSLGVWSAGFGSSLL